MRLERDSPLRAEIHSTTQPPERTSCLYGRSHGPMERWYCRFRSIGLRIGDGLHPIPCPCSRADCSRLCPSAQSSWLSSPLLGRPPLKFPSLCASVRAYYGPVQRVAWTVLFEFSRTEPPRRAAPGRAARAARCRWPVRLTPTRGGVVRCYWSLRLFEATPRHLSSSSWPKGWVASVARPPPSGSGRTKVLNGSLPTPLLCRFSCLALRLAFRSAAEALPAGTLASQRGYRK